MLPRNVNCEAMLRYSPPTLNVCAPREIVSGVGNRRPGTMRGTLVSQPMERLAVLANRAYGVARQSCQVISAMKIALSEGGGVNEIAWACVGAGFAIIAFGVILRVMEIRLVSGALGAEGRGLDLAALVSSIRAKLDARPTEDERVPPLDDERNSAPQGGERDLQLERAKNEARTKQLELDAVIRQGENDEDDFKDPRQLRPEEISAARGRGDSQALRVPHGRRLRRLHRLRH